MAYSYYSPLVIDHTKVPTADQTNFAVLINLTDNRLRTLSNGGHASSAAGFDIRPYSDSALATPLSFELERYNSTSGELVMWVKIPTLSHTVDTTFYLAYGDSSLTTNGSSNATWDANYLGVWHLGNGTTLSLADSTANANTLVNTGSVGAAAGKVDGAAGTFDGSSQALVTTNTIDLSAVTAITLSCWCNISGYVNGTFASLFHYSDPAADWFGTNGAFTSTPDEASDWGVFLRSSDAFRNGGTFTRPAAGAHHCVFQYDTALTAGGALGVKAFIDGTAQTITQVQSGDGSAGFIGDTTPFKFYICAQSPLTAFFACDYVDEVRLSKVARSVDWISTLFNNQNSPSTFMTIGSEVPIGGGGGPGGGAGTAGFFLW